MSRGPHRIWIEPSAGCDEILELRSKASGDGREALGVEVVDTAKDGDAVVGRMGLRADRRDIERVEDGADILKGG